MGIFLGVGALRLMRKARRKGSAASKADGARGLIFGIGSIVGRIRSGFRSPHSAQKPG
jgi:hypothetical protein